MLITGPPNVLLAGVCRLSSSVTLPAGGHQARWRSGGWHCTAGQYGYVPLKRNLVVFSRVRVAHLKARSNRRCKNEMNCIEQFAVLNVVKFI